MSLQPSSLRDSDKAVLLERVFLEQYEMDAEAPQRRKTEASGVVKNPHDPDVQWAAKDLAKKKQWEGYKVQIAETVAEDGKAKEKGEPTEQFVTEVTTTEAIASDLDGISAGAHINNLGTKEIDDSEDLFPDSSFSVHFD